MVSERSSTGCWTCRLRKKKCQEERPDCSTCAALRITCHGYSEKKPAWMDGGPSEKAEAERIKRTIKLNNRQKRKTPSTDLAEKNGPLSTGDRGLTRFSRKEVTSPPLTNEGSASLTCTSMKDTELKSEQRNLSCLGCSLKSFSSDYNGREATLLMHYLDVVFPLQFRFYQPLVSEGGRGWLLSILLRTRPLYHAALSLSAYHQSASYSGTVVATNDHNLMDLQKHHCLALAELRKYIDRLSLETGASQIKTRVEILACMICLISFEVFKGQGNDWPTHLQAARTIFMDLKDDLLLPLDDLNSKNDTGEPQTSDSVSLSLDETLALDFFATALIWFDVISSVTIGTNSEYFNIYSNILQIESGRIQLCKLMGSQNWVMTAIMDISLLAEWKTVREDNGDLSQSQLAKSVATIEERLENGMRENRARQISNKYDPCGARTRESQFVTQVFAWATKVYLYVIQSGAYPRVPEIKASVLEALALLRDVPDGRWIRYLVWPFCVISCMADEEYQDEFRQIAEMASMDKGLFCNFQNAASIMEECWRGRKSQPCIPWSWTTAMSSLGVKILLV